MQLMVKQVSDFNEIYFSCTNTREKIMLQNKKLFILILLQNNSIIMDRLAGLLTRLRKIAGRLSSAR